MKTAVQTENAIRYDPYDDRTQMARQIERYPLSFTRVPSQPLIERPLTLSELTGPAGLERRLGAGKLDLSRAAREGSRAIGQLISVSGRVVDEDGSPIAGAVVEIWQANSSGKYIHEQDRFEAPLDANFTGEGRLITDSEGRYEFLTVKPGAYPVLESGWWWRPPHIHFSIFGPSWMNRYVTQIFFPGEPLNEIDLLLNGVRDEEARQGLIFEAKTPAMGDVKMLPFERDFVLRGKRATPELR
ncbi:MAG TPA: protocatechuate 3,4-dioxygenase subunit beta [Bryobacteraceae bacterium]|jgi:protocatechuate 3,4-dioxygenase beta subunit